MSNITLELKARHFAGTSFFGCGMCAIEKAAQEVFKVSANDIWEGVEKLKIVGLATYAHTKYDRLEFNKDKQKAAALNYSDAVIRTITLVKQ